ncbi:hypothetical protein DV735_g1824, partial [Chaetothyriales sp. CBS 134920]
MPRPRVRDEDRKRVAQACDTCKRRKEKCDGQHPCLLCKRRGREADCAFTLGFSARRSKRDSVSTSHTGSSQTQSNGHAQPSPLDPLLSDHGIAIPSKPYQPSPDTNEYPPIETSPSASSIRHMTLNAAYHPSPSTVTVDGTSNTDREIAIESLLTLSSGPTAQIRPGFMDASHATTEQPFKFCSQPAAPRPDQGVQAHQPAFSQHRQDSGPELEPDTYTRAPVPKLARLLKDGHGKFVFVGDSSNLAFVQNIRRLVKSEIGESGLTSDSLRHTMVENISPPPTLQKMYTLRKPGLAEAKELVRAYSLATSGVIDLFDIDDLVQGIETWRNGKGAAIDRDEEERLQRQQQQSGVGEFSASTFYLVLAIGMQVRGTKGRELKNNGSNSVASYASQAEMYLQRGRELVTSSFMDDPSLLTVQSYILIVFYMLTVCRRNGAFMLLGIAVRAAYALGLHRSDISSLFEAKERRSRERVWKSLRTLDLYMSASLGRPPATSEIDGGSVSWDGKERSYDGVKVDGLDSSAMLRMCFIFERILNEVYCRREIRVQLVESISRQSRDWTLQLPVGLRADGLDLKGEGQTLVHTIGVAHLKGSYYWSIILLTRPFLIFKDDDDVDANTTRNVTTTLSEACIDAALRSVEIATDLIHTPGVPKRLFMVSNSTFVSAMVIGFAIFGDFDRAFPLLSSIDQAIAILSILAQDDPSARRYEQISTYLRQAAAEHIRRRDENEVGRRTQDISNIFGNPTQEVEGERSVAQAILMPQDVPMGDALTGADNFFQQEPWQLSFDLQLDTGPILTTSGTLAANGDDAAEDPFDLSKYGFDQAGEPDSFGALIGSEPLATDEFPLISLLTEYDQVQDPYLMVGT